jgi:hypothetical protein
MMTAPARHGKIAIERNLVKLDYGCALEAAINQA